MLTCKQAAVLLSQSQDRQLSLREQGALRLHLLVCDTCRKFRQQVEFLSRASRQFFGRGDPPA